jgi:hypothetical protein
MPLLNEPVDGGMRCGMPCHVGGKHFDGSLLAPPNRATDPGNRSDGCGTVSCGL